MHLLMIGINHRTANVEQREKLALAAPDVVKFYEEVHQRFDGVECIVLSTCNRTEIYVATSEHGAPGCKDLCRLLAEFGGVVAEDLENFSICREQADALHHLFRVATGLDSMVLGETQVLGQLRRAYGHATKHGAVGPVFHRVFQHALATAKQMRSQYGIDTGCRSIGSVAVGFARQIFSDFSDKTIVGVGAGEMAKNSLLHMMKLSPRHLWLTNRSQGRAIALADHLHLDGPGSGVRPWEDLGQLLVEADVLLTSTGADRPLLTVTQFQAVLKKRRRRPLFVIDLAVPRDVESGVGQLSNVYLYNLDDLQSVVAHAADQRSEQVDPCDRVLAEAARSCLTQVQNRNLGALIRQLRRRLHTIGDAELQRTVHKLDADSKVASMIDEHTRRLINKILHLPLSQLDNADAQAPLDDYATALRLLFSLDTPDAPLTRGKRAKPLTEPPTSIPEPPASMGPPDSLRDQSMVEPLRCPK